MAVFQYGVGDVISAEGGDFAVVHGLGAGGMGEVYDVEDRLTGRRYILKKLHGSLHQRDDLKERFISEARAMAQLDHRNIVQVFRIAWTRDGDAKASSERGLRQDDKRMPMYLMERLPGESLRNALKRKRRIPMHIALPIAVQMLTALEYIHERKLVHRDVKPDNVFLVSREREPQYVKLLDFGVMRIVLAAKDRSTFVGTPRYAAPEQLLFNADGPTIDIYAAALTLFEMLTGNMPWGTSANDLASCQERALVVPPRLSAWGTFPGELEAQLAIALDPEPAKRHRHITNFIDELSRINNALPSVSAPVTSPGEADDGRVLPLPKTDFTPAALAPATEPEGPTFDQLRAMMGAVATSPPDGASTPEAPRGQHQNVAITPHARYEAVTPNARKPSELTTPPPKGPTPAAANSEVVSYVTSDPESWRDVQAAAAAMEIAERSSPKPSGADRRPAPSPQPVRHKDGKSTPEAQRGQQENAPGHDKPAAAKQPASRPKRAPDTVLEPPVYEQRIRAKHDPRIRRSMGWHISRFYQRNFVLVMGVMLVILTVLVATVVQTVRSTSAAPAHSLRRSLADSTASERG